jgi:preprotein translocase subunit SecG
MLRTVLTVVEVFSCFIIVALVLIQRGRGADAGAGFGSGASGTVFGARGASTGLSRATAIAAFVFMANSLALAYMGNKEAATAKPLLENPAPVSAPAVPAPAASIPATTVPSATVPATTPEPQVKP